MHGSRWLNFDERSGKAGFKSEYTREFPGKRSQMVRVENKEKHDYESSWAKKIFLF